MSLSLYVFPCLAVVLQGLLLWRLSRRESRWRYPYLAAFVAYRLLGDVVLFPIYRYKPEWFGVAYWRIETTSLFLQFLINWEFYRGLFRRSGLRELAWKLLVFVELGMLPVVLALGWSQASSVHYPHVYFLTFLEQYLDLAQALLLLASAGVAWYYAVPMGRNLRGLGLGFGVYLLLRVVNFASVQVFRGFSGYWRVVTPVTFICMIAIFLWAFWEYAPSPELSEMADVPYLAWQSEWQRIWITIRKVLRGDIG
jgi:hypothetical protein